MQIDEQRVVSRLMRLMECAPYTPEGQERALHALDAMLRAEGIEPTIHSDYRRNLLVAEIGAGDKVIVTHVHLDVVPGDCTPRRDGDVIYGRGAADALGGAAVAVEVLALLNRVRDLPIRLRLVAVLDEEDTQQVHSFGEYMATRGADAAFVTTFEPTGEDLVTETLGTMFVTFDVLGTMTHSGYPVPGGNAIEGAFALWPAVLGCDFAGESSPSFPEGPILMPTVVAGGDAANMSAARCRITFSIRYLPGQDPETILGEIGAAAKALGLTMETGATLVMPAVEAPYGPLYEALEDTLRRRRSSSDIHTVRHGGSDLAYALGVPCVEFGPRGPWPTDPSDGAGTGHHGPKEAVRVSSLVFVGDTFLEWLIGLS